MVNDARVNFFRTSTRKDQPQGSFASLSFTRN